MSITFRTELVADIHSLGLSKQYGKKDTEVSQFLKMFGLSLLPPAEVCDCFVLEVLSNLPNDKRVEQFCGYLLENYIDADSNFPPPVWSECIASSLRTIKACELFHAHFNALLYSAHHESFVLAYTLKKYRMRPTSKWEVSLQQDLKKSATSKKEDLISPKIGQYRVNRISRIAFVSSVSYKFLPHTHTLVIPYCLHLRCHLPLL